MKTSFKVLHEKALQITKTYLGAESDLISVLQEIDECRGYREMGFKSLFEYSTQGLGLSESVSFNFIAIARKSKEVPKLQERWLAAAATSSKRELEKEIAKEFPEAHVQERMRYVSEKCIELKLGISEELHKMLKHAQDLVSSHSGEAASLEETLQAALEIYIEKKDPHKKAERAEKRKADSDEKSEFTRTTERVTPISPVPGQVLSNPRVIPAKLQHAIRLRDKAQCSFKSAGGVKCHEKRWLDFHPIRPLSEGGQTTFENLTLLCRGHHRLMHHESLLTLCRAAYSLQSLS